MRKAEKMRRALMRTNTRLLLTSVVVFQALALALLALRPDNASLQPLVLLIAVYGYVSNKKKKKEEGEK